MNLFSTFVFTEFPKCLLLLFPLDLLGPELKLSKNEPCGADCFQLLEEVQKKSAEQASKDNTNDENSSSCNPNKVKKNSSVDSGNEASSEDSNDSTTRSSLPRNENSNSGNGSGNGVANKKFNPTGSQQVRNIFIGFTNFLLQKL